MLQLSPTLINCSVMSLRTGTEVAIALEPIINPNNLKIEGFYCQDNRSKQPLILLTQDVRDFIPQGLVINDHDVLVEQGDLVRLQDIMNLHFSLIGKRVITGSKERLGKVSDYATDTSSMFIKKIYVSQSVLKSFSGGNLGIDRTQILEITDSTIIVQDLIRNIPVGARAIA